MNFYNILEGVIVFLIGTSIVAASKSIYTKWKTADEYRVLLTSFFLNIGISFAILVYAVFFADVLWLKLWMVFCASINLVCAIRTFMTTAKFVKRTLSKSQQNVTDNESNDIS